jgi:hypothetical protein
MFEVYRKVSVVQQMNANLIPQPLLNYSFFRKNHLLDGKDESVDDTSHLRCLCDVREIVLCR